MPPIKVDKIIAYKLIFLPKSNFMICQGAKLKPTKAPESTLNIKPARPIIIKITNKNASTNFPSLRKLQFQYDKFVETYQPVECLKYYNVS